MGNFGFVIAVPKKFKQALTRMENNWVHFKLSKWGHHMTITKLVEPNHYGLSGLAIISMSVAQPVALKVRSSKIILTVKQS